MPGLEPGTKAWETLMIPFHHMRLAGCIVAELTSVAELFAPPHRSLQIDPQFKSRITR